MEKIKSRNFLFTYENHPDWILNLHLIKGNRFNFIIDTGFGTGSVEPIVQIAGTDKPFIVINTHFHWDHIWGNCYFENALIISHELCPEMINESWEEAFERNKDFVDGKALKILPNMVFEKELYFPDERIRIFHSPGHTADSISVLDEIDGVLSVGDNVGDTMERIVPDIDAGEDAYRKTLKMYNGLDFETCINCHNRIFDKNIFELIESKL